jgi:amino acid transporter
MNNFFKQIFYLACLIILLVLPFFVFAAFQGDHMKNLESVGLDSGYQEAEISSMSQYVGTVIEVFFSLLGIIFTVLILYAGFKWMKARGREEEVKAAQDIIRRAIIGLIITVSAYAISNFIFEAL